MWPEIGSIRSYYLLYFSAFAIHFVLSYRIAARDGLERRVWITAGLCYLVAMTVGAKILYDVRHLQLDLGGVFSLGYYWEGGLWGGLLAYFVLAVPLVLLLTRQRRAGVDLVALAIPIPYILAKAGCFLTGCCWGRPCDYFWAVTFPDGDTPAPTGVALHPTQVYEVLLMGVLLILFKVLDGERWRGTFLLWFLVVFGIGRAAIDRFRGDTDLYVYLGPVTLLQLVLLVIAFISIVLLVLRRRGALLQNGTVETEERSSS